MLRTTLIAAALSAALASTPALAQQAAKAGVSAADVELIPREILFGNPERSNVQISPDGRYLSWVAPVDGVANVWVAPADNPAQARAVTADKARGPTVARTCSPPTARVAGASSTTCRSRIR